MLRSPNCDPNTQDKNGHANANASRPPTAPVHMSDTSDMPTPRANTRVAPVMPTVLHTDLETVAGTTNGDLDDRDVAMGSSRTTRGFSRGRAAGNVESLADMGKFSHE